MLGGIKLNNRKEWARICKGKPTCHRRRWARICKGMPTVAKTHLYGWHIEHKFVFNLFPVPVRRARRVLFLARARLLCSVSTGTVATVGTVIRLIFYRHRLDRRRLDRHRHRLLAVTCRATM